MKKSFIIILVLALLALGGYWWFSTQKDEATAPVAEEIQESSEEGVVNSVSVEVEASGSVSGDEKLPPEATRLPDGSIDYGPGGTPSSTEN